MLRRTCLYASCASLVGCGAGYYFLKYEHMKSTISKNEKYNVHTNVPNRQEMINKMKNNKYQLIVIGGGATGAGLALDASSRGISTCLVESNDFASGTSSKSTKLLHGGIRYLEDAVKTLNFSKFLLVWESLEERCNAIRACEYMCRPIPIIMPIYNVLLIPYFWVGIKSYDLLAKLVCCFETKIPSGYFLNKSNTEQHFPLINSDNLKGSLVYYDGQHNDSRMNILLLLTAALENYVEGFCAAHVANYCKVVDFIRDDNTQKILGVKVLDKIANEEFKVYGKVVVNCGGPFCDEVRKICNPESQSYIRPVAGSHIVLPYQYTNKKYGLIIPETTDKRVLFLLPWENNTIVGTTDERSALTESPKPQNKEIQFIVDEICKYVKVKPETLKSDINSEWCGLRPLVLNNIVDDTSTATISRSHKIIFDSSGLVSVMGGKWTTYRRMAQDALDEILKVHKHEINCSTSCRTKNLKLFGSFDENNEYEPSAIHANSGTLPFELIKKYKNLKYESAKHLVRNYGFAAIKVLNIGRDMNLNCKLHEDYPFLQSEIVYAVRHEMAFRVSDVIGRRVRIAFLDVNAAKLVVPTVINLMSKELKWSEKQIKEANAEAESYLNQLRSC